MPGGGVPLLRWLDAGGDRCGPGNLGGDGEARLDVLACLAQPRAGAARRQARSRRSATDAMTADRWEHIQELFAAALDLAPEQRTAYVRERAEDAALRAEVLALLQAHEARGRLDSIADRLDALSAVTPACLPAVFSGRYRIE